MFERYNEKARRTIFFARYEASVSGSPYMETEHLLLGLLREDRPTLERALGGAAGWTRFGSKSRHKQRRARRHRPRSTCR